MLSFIPYFALFPRSFRFFEGLGSPRDEHVSACSRLLWTQMLFLVHSTTVSSIFSMVMIIIWPYWSHKVRRMMTNLLKSLQFEQNIQYCTPGMTYPNETSTYKLHVCRFCCIAFSIINYISKAVLLQHAHYGILTTYPVGEKAGRRTMPKGKSDFQYSV